MVEKLAFGGLKVFSPDVKKLILFFLFCVSLSSCADKRQKIGEDIVSRIETYKKQLHTCQTVLSEVGIEEKESGPVYYDKKSDTSYIVYYGRGLGESIVYDSQTKKMEKRSSIIRNCTLQSSHNCSYNCLPGNSFQIIHHQP